MLAKIISFWTDFVDILFPRICPACREVLAGTERYLCTSCLVLLPRLREGGMASASVALKFAGFQEVASVNSWLAYQPKGKVQALLRSLKYDDNPDLGVFLGHVCAGEWCSDSKIIQVDLIVPVPLHPRKQKERGYNQSESFAKGFSEESGIPVDADLLKRDVYTLSQTQKTRQERIAAMQGVFSLRKGVDLGPLKVLLVDDVLTTGATLEGCVEVLVRNGCREIHIMTIAAAQS